MLIPFESQSARIAAWASPAPRRIALFRNSRMIVAIPAYMIRAWVVPTAIVSASAPIRASKRGAKTTPTTPSANDTTRPSPIACTPARAAPRRSRSP